jgi:hypothetical protein
MLETLAGRLKWERTAYGFRVSIPVRSSMAGLIGSLAGICLAGAWIVYWSLKEAHETGTTGSMSGAMTRWVAIGALAGSLCALARWLLRTRTARTVLTVDQTETRIQREIAGVCWSTRTFATCAISDLQYIPPPNIWSAEEPKTVESEIRFMADHKMHSFAAGIKESEAAALIDRMREVYDFPNDLAPAQIGTDTRIFS